MHKYIATISQCLLMTALATASQQNMELFYTSAASFSANATSNEALPIGNGKLAAMVYGGVSEEIIQFNEDTIWAGQVHDYSNPGASGYLEQIRNYIWNGQGEDAYNNAVQDHFMSVPIRQSPYQPAGELRLDFPHDGSVSNYRRTLDLETATASISYTYGGVDFLREVFASYPDQVIVIRLTASQAGQFSFTGRYNTPHTRRTVSAEGADLVLDARVNDDTNSRRQSISDIEFQARTRVRVEGGSVEVAGSQFTVTDADAVTIMLNVSTNFVRFDNLEGDPASRSMAAIEAADTKGYETVRADQLADYQELFTRVTIDLGGTGMANTPTNQRLENLNTAFRAFKDVHGWGDPEAFTEHFSGDDPHLVALNLQMARYLMISGSRPGSQPLTLQGKWNNELDPSWESKMTLNINQEMNYWMAEMANLAESHLPMTEMVRDLSESGAVVAREHYGADGWVVHHNTDLWRGAAPINNPGGVWPTGGAWLSMHMWWHYEYSGNLAYLDEIYPLMKGAAEFFVDALVEDPRAGNEPYLLMNPTHSPEHPNPALDDDGELVAGTTMDSQLIRELFGYVINAGEILDRDPDFRATLADMRDRLPPNQIGKHGQIQEWLEDVDVPENPEIGGHRHISHLVDLFPGDAIHPAYEPEFADAAEVILDWKGDPSNNTAWSRAWKMVLRNALFQGDHAYMILVDVLANSHTDNMTFSTKGNENQIDGNMGVAMGILQFFLQSTRGEIYLLPALPERIPSGAITGLRTKGGFEVDLEWNEGVLAEATIRSSLGGPATVRSATPIVKVLADGGPTVPLEIVGEGLYRFPTETGISYQIFTGQGGGTNPWENIVVPDGYATQNGGTTGGGDAEPIFVSTPAEFRSAVGNDNPAVVVVQGRLNVGDVNIGSNKTIVGADYSSGLFGGTIGVGGNNYIFQNLIVGPSGEDAMELSGATNVFVHKCEFYDGADGNLDIVREADWVTVSWCKFYYVDQVNHKFSILLGNSDDRTSDRGKLHVTLHHNWFAENCDSRMPRVRYGHVHIYNNYYNSVENNYCIGIGVECHIRLENSHFDTVNNPWSDYGGTENGEIGWSGLKFENSTQPTFMPNTYPVFDLPYTYLMDEVDEVKGLVRHTVYGSGNKKVGREIPTEPGIVVSRKSIEVHIAQGMDAPEETFEVWNSGTRNLNYLIQEDSDMFSVSPTTGSSSSAEDKVLHTVSFTTSTLAIGSHEAVITIADDGSGSTNASEAIAVRVVIGPEIATNTSNLDASASEGVNPDPGSFMVWNSGMGTLLYTVSEDIDWLSVSPAEGASGGDADKQAHAVTYDMAGFAAGTYTGTITVASSVGGVSPRTITISAVIDAVPRISVDKESLNLTVVKGTYPDTVTFDVWNSGTGDLSYTVSEFTTWMTVNPMEGSSGGENDKQIHSVYVNPRGLDIGEYTGEISLAAANAPNSPATVTLQLSVLDPNAGPWDPDENGDTDTGSFLGWINVIDAPWIWSYSLAGWIFIANEAVTEFGAWSYFPKE